METLSLKDYVAQNNVRAIGTVYASNDNKYPMVALETDTGVEHLMLSKNAGEKWPVGTSPIDFAKHACVVTFEHEALGETVTRLTSGSNVAVEALFD